MVTLLTVRDHKSNFVWCLSLGSMDEGVSEGLPSMQSTSNAGGHAEDDERYHDLLQLAERQVTGSGRQTYV